MDKELAKTFATRVTQANRTELVVIMYEVILSDLKAAKENYDKGDVEQFIQEVKHGQKFLSELMATLNYQQEIAHDLMSLYIYVNKALVTAIFKKSSDSLAEAESILKILLQGFGEISKQDKTGPVMKNTQQVYAGLTYGKGVLNETFVDPNQQSRGFKA
ncbi:hypothetical protein acsn021_00300 [Anaerocolumna cellulosilytica]|uniref:Uncharacterized protein n=1 Tax=Anaerocolumna cellulosilytica TaxID=433286 RepID=A0A6S6QZM1_9FIRM|nr:flagellar protein FliS [Anaerocolumna cellulosilytica]MBB5196219.1 flagellar protein FliS [Anaerocolumna cellulosilytica]BCJ92461.1 hypothetical protein acsn021_00300 [Anaerocolumna cellulosilytica]